MFYQFMLVGIGGFLGAISRFGINLMVQSYTTHLFPISTLFVNVLGCTVIGMLFGYFRNHHLLSMLTMLVGIGFLGSFTTFSAFSFETIQLIKNNELKLALLNIGANLILCLIGVVLGGYGSSYFLRAR